MKLAWICRCFQQGCQKFHWAT